MPLVISLGGLAVGDIDLLLVSSMAIAVLAPPGLHDDALADVGQMWAALPTAASSNGRLVLLSKRADLYDMVTLPLRRQS